MDKRWRQTAELIVNYSTMIQPNERVMIAMGEVDTLPLVRAVYEEVIKAGGYPQVQFLSDFLNHSMLRFGSQEQISWVPEIEAYGMKWADVYITLRGAHNLYELADIPDENLVLHRRSLGKISSLRWENTRWIIVRVPNRDFAQQAETDEETILDMFFDSILQDWSENVANWQRIADRLSEGHTARLVAKGTDLKFNVKGRQWLVGDGRINLPDGEIFTAPIHEEMDGKITFEFPGVLGGRLVPDIQLEWRAGKLMNARASANESFLHKIIETDPGASNIGEFAFGVNQQIDRFCKDIFFDEKIGGTIHIALGRAYPACGGTNQSAIHWDIIKDTRKESSFYLDGEKIFENGKFLF